MQVKRVKITDLKRATYNPKSRTEESRFIGQLEKSIAEIGLIYPIAVTKDMDVIDGHRRLMAAENLGWEDIPAIITEGDKYRIYADVNANSYKLSGNQALQVWLKEPLAVTTRSRNYFEKAEAQIGRKLLESMADHGRDYQNLAQALGEANPDLPDPELRFLCNRLFLIRHEFDPESVAAVAQAVVSEAAALCGRISTDIRCGELQEKALENRKQAALAMQDKIREYERILHQALPELHRQLKEVEIAAAAAVLIQAGKKQTVQAR